jgi:hypothetical protein
MRIKGLKTMAITAAAISTAFVASGGIAMASTSGTAAGSGTVTGLTASSFSNVQLNGSLSGAVVSPTITTAGTYYVTGDVQVTIQPNDSVTCQIGTTGATYSATNPSSTANMWAVIPINLSVSTTAGHIINIGCRNYAGGAGTYVNSATVNATLVTDSTGTPTITLP